MMSCNYFLSVTIYVLYVYVLSVSLQLVYRVVVSHSLNNIFGHVTSAKLVRTPTWWQRWDGCERLSQTSGKVRLQASRRMAEMETPFSTIPHSHRARQRGGHAENKYAALLSGGRERRRAHLYDDSVVEKFDYPYCL